jgi:hypothetical protein
MRIARKLFLLSAMALAAMAFSATSASAQIEVYGEPSGDPCSDVTFTPPTTVEGGCHVEFVGEEVPLEVHAPIIPTGEMRISNCDVHLEAYVGPAGEGYITSAALTDTGDAGVGCTRKPCRTAAGTFLPWEIHIVEEAPGDESVEATFCLVPTTSADGTAGTPCTVHLPLGGEGHAYTFGDPGGPTQYFCEGLPIHISGGFTSSSLETEAVEIVHHLP